MTYWPLSQVGTCCDHTKNWHSEVDGHCRVEICRCPMFETEIRMEREVQCQARHGQRMTLRCAEKVIEAAEYDGHDHWALDTDGQTMHWTDLVAMWPAIDGRFLANPDRSRFETKDSGVRAEYDSGMVRDTQEGKARFELLLPLGVPYRDQFLVRVAELMARGAEKYDSRNWEKATGDEELERFKSSALRHLMQWAAGETDEDHAAAVVFNLLGYETTKGKRDGR